MNTQILNIGAICTYMLFISSASPTVVDWLGGIQFVPPPLIPIEVVNPFLCRDCSGRMNVGSNARIWFQPCCPVCRCGVEGDTKIVGGSLVPRGKYPWIASVTFNNEVQTGGCGATLIASRWAVTAAHCVFSGTITSIVLGENDISSIDALDVNRKDVRIAKIVTHPLYNNPGSFSNDIALLKLAEEVDLSVHTPACMPALGRDFTGNIGTVYGWGKPDHCVRFPSALLQEVSQEIVSDETCAAANGDVFQFLPTFGGCVLVHNATYTGLISEDMLCAQAPGKSGCQGDSGGPFTVREGDQHYLVGVVSWGFGCGSFPTVYAEVPKLKQWIDDTIAVYGGATYCPN